ncbi:MAG: hypothetical protein ACRDL3_00490 [Solirubrobacterales bacterium]
MIAVVNSVIGGAAVALAVAATGDPPLGIPVAIGGTAAVASLILMHRAQMNRFWRGAMFTDVLSPSDFR